ncbi:MAG: hypothetical protein WC676_07085 [Candidatus Omnitrophota bacterium]
MSEQSPSTHPMRKVFLIIAIVLVMVMLAVSMFMKRSVEDAEVSYRPEKAQTGLEVKPIVNNSQIEKKSVAPSVSVPKKSAGKAAKRDAQPEKEIIYEAPLKSNILIQ